MKTKNRVLLSAGMLFALTGVTLGASTYAWFTAQNTAQVTMGTISAVLPEALSITPTEVQAMKAMTDVSSVDGKTFYKGTYSGEELSNITQVATAEDGANVYRNINEFTLKMTVADGYGEPTLYLKNIVIAGATKEEATDTNLANALRVAVFAGAYQSGTAKAIYNNQEGDNKGLDNTTGVEASVDGILKSGDTAFSTGGYGVELGNATSGSLKVTVVTWLEGTNESCVTYQETETGIQDTSKANITLTFAAKENVAK